MSGLKKSNLMRYFFTFLAVVGPGIITGSVDNDAGGITTYSVAGAHYGYDLLWTLVPSFIALVVIQEMNARMGIITGKGLADLIRECFGVKTTFFIFVCLFIADIGNTTAEFAGVAGSMEILGLSKYLVVPLAALLVWLLVVKGNYRTAEKIFLLFSAFLLLYIVSAIMTKPEWGQIYRSIMHPPFHQNTEYLSLVIGMIGTTIAPWMQFYMQSAVIEKGLTVEDYKYAKWDVILGGIATVVVAFFIIVACASTLYKAGIKIEEARDAAASLQPLAGRMASVLFAFGLFIASVFSATILPLATAFYICEAFGFEAGVDKTWKSAPVFYTLFTVIIIIAVAIILIPGAPLIAITIWTQILNGILLPVVLVSMIRMVNNRDIMGEYTNSPLSNIIGWMTIIILIVLTAVLFVIPLLEKLHLT
ncbi:divalent metal cation transporter [Desulfofundulus thermobenzoicus]|uniref:Divalent metal cation transporter n=1 Tax=Desulfofundulus thermobenzoicus TaxID=29376 RepID=A0A6N7IN08_9FIRM|nr:Nramp family divalent metal transporter [Desulfofundulus thermobenzoicus]MQL50997.1 divalent metal cation transporter [Desulfofundulus thermobenzoicus]